MQKYKIDENFDGVRIAKFIRKVCENAPFSLVAKLFRKKAIKVNGKKAKAEYVLVSGDEVILPDSLDADNLKPANNRADGGGYGAGEGLNNKDNFNISENDIKDFKASILYEDDNLIAVNKMYDLPTQAGTGVVKSLDRIAAVYFPGAKLLHRLDRHTTGIVLLAKNDKTARLITAGFKDKEIEKVYWAVIVGSPNIKEGLVDLPLIKGMNSQREKVIVDHDNGKSSQTGYDVVQTVTYDLDDSDPNYFDSDPVQLSWVRLFPLTGRTHQLRVHMQAIGHPIYGDYKYGGDDAMPLGKREKMHLHAFSIDLSNVYPLAGIIEAQLPQHIKKGFDKIGFDINIIKD